MVFVWTWFLGFVLVPDSLGLGLIDNGHAKEEKEKKEEEKEK